LQRNSRRSGFGETAAEDYPEQDEKSFNSMVDNESTTDELLPSEDIDDFDYIDNVPKCIRSFRGTTAEFEDSLRAELRSISGYWVHSHTSVSWISHCGASSTGWGSCVDVLSFGNDDRAPEIVKVSLYYNCGKVVVFGDNDSMRFRTVMKCVMKITDIDDGMYHKLVLPSVTDYAFPLLDEDELLIQREEYQNRW
jgi:hypothetical protein